jgi:hypothetical protein
VSIKRPADPDELALVQKALTCCVNGCVEWDPDQADRVRSDPRLQGLTPEAIQEDTIQYAVDGGEVRQVKEKRMEWQHREFYYKVILPYYPEFPKGLFVELELTDRDEDYPVVHLVNAHD